MKTGRSQVRRLNASSFLPSIASLSTISSYSSLRPIPPIVDNGPALDLLPPAVFPICYCHCLQAMEENWFVGHPSKGSPDLVMCWFWNKSPSSLIDKREKRMELFIRLPFSLSLSLLPVSLFIPRFFLLQGSRLAVAPVYTGRSAPRPSVRPRPANEKEEKPTPTSMFLFYHGVNEKKKKFFSFTRFWYHTIFVLL